MIEIAKIREIAQAKTEGSDLFVVEITVSPSNEIEILLDSDTSVGIDSCVELSKAIEAELDREAEDFELMVASAGIGQPLKLLRQYQKLLGKGVEVVLKSGIKLEGRLDAATQESITLTYGQMMAVEGKKRKQSVEVQNTFAMSDVKQTVEHLDYK